MDTPALVTGILPQSHSWPYYSAQFKIINFQHDETPNPVEILAQVEHGSLSTIPGLHGQPYLSDPFKQQILAMAGDMQYTRQQKTDNKTGLRVGHTYWEEKQKLPPLPAEQKMSSDKFASEIAMGFLRDFENSQGRGTLSNLMTRLYHDVKDNRLSTGN